MRLTKSQQEVYDNLMLILQRYGRAYTFGWALGQLISLSTHDPNLRRTIKNKSQGPAASK
jgi:hypothetical protein